MARKIIIVPYDPAWPAQFDQERQRLKVLPFLEIEHFGSTAIPGLRAKPVIDIMAKVADLPVPAKTLGALGDQGFVRSETGMKNRPVLHKSPVEGLCFHLHILPAADWDFAHERLMRDYLLANPQMAQAYGDLKDRLAAEHPNDREAYTRAKTGFIQAIVDAARDARNLPRVDVWND